MSWSELERFEADVEADAALQRSLKHCRSVKSSSVKASSRQSGKRGSREHRHWQWPSAALRRAELDAWLDARRIRQWLVDTIQFKALIGSAGKLPAVTSVR
jgi:hypothetical protein